MARQTLDPASGLSLLSLYGSGPDLYLSVARSGSRLPEVPLNVIFLKLIFTSPEHLLLANQGQGSGLD